MAEQCIFCQIAKGSIPSKKVYEDDKVVAVLDINPALPGHLLVIPKEHISIMPQIQPSLVGHLGVVAKKLSHLILKKLGVEGVSVFIANGGAAGQRSPHFMMHVIPRIEEDNVGLNPEKGQLSDEDLRKLQSSVTGCVDKYFRKKPVEMSTQAPNQRVTNSDSKNGNKNSSNKDSLDAISDLLGGK